MTSSGLMAFIQKYLTKMAYKTGKAAYKVASEEYKGYKQEKAASGKASPVPRSPSQPASTVVVYGYTQQFLIGPEVQVFWNGSPVGTVKKGDFISFDISENGEVSFKASIRKASLRVQAGRVTNIKISWDRVSGKLVPQIVETVPPGA